MLTYHNYEILNAEIIVETKILRIQKLILDIQKNLTFYKSKIYLTIAFPTAYSIDL